MVVRVMKNDEVRQGKDDAVYTPALMIRAWEPAARGVTSGLVSVSGRLFR